MVNLLCHQSHLISADAYDRDEKYCELRRHRDFQEWAEFRRPHCRRIVLEIFIYGAASGRNFSKEVPPDCCELCDLCNIENFKSPKAAHTPQKELIKSHEIGAEAMGKKRHLGPSHNSIYTNSNHGKRITNVKNEHRIAEKSLHEA